MNIVVDVNVLAYFLLPGPYSAQAENLRAVTTHWHAPPLWRSEFRNILAGLLRRSLIRVDAALAVLAQAEAMLAERDVEPDSRTVLALVAATSCTAYDCEYVAAARQLGLPLVTEDRQLLKEFPGAAVSMSGLVASLK